MPDQDRAYDLLDTFNKHSVVMFSQQQRIYANLAKALCGCTVLEAGCGNGVGTAILSQTSSQIIGTDVNSRNTAFAKGLYPWIPFYLWDIREPTSLRAEVVVCVEAIEHVEDLERSLRNLAEAALDCLWISTPNGVGKSIPPENPYHVQEYTPIEFTDAVAAVLHRSAVIRHYDTWEILGVDTLVDPLVYEIQL
jgi:2-polyprenyl-3-methyl-5-hydroxy-6-metoxy-1,4-benzoquinol methylase